MHYGRQVRERLVYLERNCTRLRLSVDAPKPELGVFSIAEDTLMRLARLPRCRVHQRLHNSPTLGHDLFAYTEEWDEEVVAYLNDFALVRGFFAQGQGAEGGVDPFLNGVFSSIFNALDGVVNHRIHAQEGTPTRLVKAPLLA